MVCIVGFPQFEQAHTCSKRKESSIQLIERTIGIVRQTTLEFVETSALPEAGILKISERPLSQIKQI